jgi:hypothetical protein
MVTKKDSIVAVKPEILLQQLPAKPDWFDRELAAVATRDGRPVFRVVDGQRELKFRNGKMDIKHLLQDDGVPMYVPVIRQVFRRQETDTQEYRYYNSIDAAREDTGEHLEDEIDFSNLVSVRAVGQPAWIVEVYISPDELGGPLEWESMRYAMLQVKGVDQKVDMLGEFPREGYYMYCFPVVDPLGRPISPGTRTIEECKKRWKLATEDSKSLQEAITDFEKRTAAFEKKSVENIVDNFYQFHGVSMVRAHGGHISKPITKVYE